MIDRCVIIGVGLIGGSLGLALNERGLARHITGVDTSEQNLKAALAGGAIHEIAELDRAVSRADLVVLATPVGAMPGLLRETGKYLKRGAVVTDVGSTKLNIVEQAEAVLGGRFVGGHPMAGSETTGFTGADPYLFENAFYLLTPTSRTAGDALALVRKVVEAIGAHVMEMSPEQHDLATAAISHLPHLVAVSLVNAVAGLPFGEKALALAAGGFRDTTRIAAGNPVMWRDIFLANRARVLEALDGFRGAVEQMETALRQGDGEQILQILSAAGKTRRELPVRSKGYLPRLYEVVVTVPDRPGVIAMLAGMLAGAGINIAEIEILRAREGYDGTIRIAFTTPEEQEQAAGVLRANEIKCRIKV